MATIFSAGTVNFSMARLVCCRVNNAQVKLPWRRNPICVRRSGQSGRLSYVTAAAAADILSEKVEKSVVEAKEVCSDDPESGECVAAWDEVEELSAAASHARDREKETSSDPLEIYCKDNPETDECRIYDN
ncbi:calvin cycle protein CP12-1, chloroplastic-like [Impatiens glandulifera]|uniref:calvin cycle protein CP12-1, chloroplastic-like n=1 Tax=Impatiens glandulifera TaxID=253017 RepID=UPI001FB1420F|nr:calvin cycle protein CP12-1, chloroplastic-like [Impatiens glandulifera]